MVGRTQEISIKRESGTIGQLLGSCEVNACWPYRIAAKGEFIQEHIEEDSMFSPADWFGLLILLDVSCPTANVLGVYLVITFSIEESAIIGS